MIYMRLDLTILFFVFINISLFTHKNIKRTYSQLEQCKSFYCVPDSNMFELKNIKKTLDNDNVNMIQKMKKLNSEQIKMWLNPITDKIKLTEPLEIPLYYKMESFQKKTEKYFSMILIIHDQTSEGEINNNQYLINVDGTTGQFIDGIVVKTYTPGSTLGDDSYVASKGIILNVEKKSKFSGDTIKIYDRENCLFPPASQHKWTGVYETFYVINSDGKIQCIKEKKMIDDSRKHK